MKAWGSVCQLRLSATRNETSSALAYIHPPSSVILEDRVNRVWIWYTEEGIGEEGGTINGPEVHMG